MNLTRLAGNAPLKRQLELETARRGLSHAYILSGPAGSGKRTLAGLLAAALVCDRRGGALPCLSCAGCRKAEGGIHPDIVRVGDDGKDISVAQVRALRADAYIRPNEAERKVYILENAQTMNASAQNAMLKLLEEGPAYAAFLLLTDNAAALLPTVRSRCEHLPLSPSPGGRRSSGWTSTTPTSPRRPGRPPPTAARACWAGRPPSWRDRPQATPRPWTARWSWCAAWPAVTSWPCWSTAWPWRSGTGSSFAPCWTRAFSCCGMPSSAPPEPCGSPTPAGVRRRSAPPAPSPPGSSPRRWACWSGCAPPAAPMWGPVT
ncbi:MAG: hypothetical protein ACLRIS_06695 [Flavonifractor plautii]